jgi:hypothetical protein
MIFGVCISGEPGFALFSLVSTGLLGGLVSTIFEKSFAGGVRCFVFGLMSLTKLTLCSSLIALCSGPFAD